MPLMIIVSLQIVKTEIRYQPCERTELWRNCHNLIFLLICRVNYDTVQGMKRLMFLFVLMLGLSFSMVLPAYAEDDEIVEVDEKSAKKVKKLKRKAQQRKAAKDEETELDEAKAEEADEEEEEADDKPKRKTPKNKAAKSSMSDVAKALAEAGYFTETEAKPKARFYIFICSASWCGPCRSLMPQVVEEYEKKMKKDRKVSLVLLGCDNTDEEARKYIEHYETDMPGVLMKKVQLENMPQIKGIPAYIVMNAKGELISTGMGSGILDWKSEIRKRPQRNKKRNR